MNFIYDQEERIRQLENYMQDIIDEFMEFSSEVALRLKDRIKESESKPRKIKKIKKITKYPDTKVLENSTKHNFFENLKKKTFPTPASHLCMTLYTRASNLDWEEWKGKCTFLSLDEGLVYTQRGSPERKTSLIKMGVIMELEGECCWPATRGVAREGGGDDEEGNGEGGNEEIRGFADIYHSMS
ncbi:hypothetical protein Tco_0730582 [Tanacetum coccineum]|uniref:Uncharacterized protein n=1 Tax=Tanacetum coccineum TaxID=301880 RepID=A0ABQ4YUN9_9ASTR